MANLAKRLAVAEASMSASSSRSSSTSASAPEVMAPSFLDLWPGLRSSGWTVEAAGAAGSGFAM